MKIFKPTWMISAIYNLQPDMLKKHDIKAVFTDLDNTLIAWNNPDGTPELKQWLTDMKKADIKVIVVSNNNEKRVQRAVEQFDVEFVSRALKPLSKGINEATKLSGYKKSEVVMVGDQLMTDILGGNLTKVKTVLVKPLVDSDAWNTKFNRFLEKFVIKSLKKNYPQLTWKEQLDD